MFDKQIGEMRCKEGDFQSKLCGKYSSDDILESYFDIKSMYTCLTMCPSVIFALLSGVQSQG